LVAGAVAGLPAVWAAASAAKTSTPATQPAIAKPHDDGAEPRAGRRGARAGGNVVKGFLRYPWDEDDTTWKAPDQARGAIHAGHRPGPGPLPAGIPRTLVLCVRGVSLYTPPVYVV
jgi:hypothetical protein